MWYSKNMTFAEAIFGEDISLKGEESALLHTLTPREEVILRKRFGIGGEIRQTLREIGKEFHIGYERVRQIEAKALRKLRHPRRRRLLENFAEL